MNDNLSNDTRPDGPKKPSQGRTILWLVAAGIGLYFVVSGVWGLLIPG